MPLPYDLHELATAYYAKYIESDQIYSRRKDAKEVAVEERFDDVPYDEQRCIKQGLMEVIRTIDPDATFINGGAW